MINLRNEITISDEGDYVLMGKRYTNEVFESLVIDMEAKTRFVIADSIFENCKTERGFFITKSTLLKNVSFIDFDCGDALHISSETHMENLKVFGAKPKMLWIKPETKVAAGKSKQRKNVSFIIDISGYEGAVSITGVPLNKIIFHPEKHVPLTYALHEEIDWEALQISKVSFWKLMIRKIKADGAEEGLFSLPPKTSKNYERSMQELAILKAHGHIK